MNRKREKGGGKNVKFDSMINGDTLELEKILSSGTGFHPIQSRFFFFFFGAGAIARNDLHRLLYTFATNHANSPPLPSMIGTFSPPRPKITSPSLPVIDI